MAENVRYYHGRTRGLAVGEYILPPTITKVRSASDYAYTAGLHRKDRVYVTTSRTDAQLFASGNREPVVYEVEPEGNLAGC